MSKEFAPLPAIRKQFEEWKIDLVHVKQEKLKLSKSFNFGSKNLKFDESNLLSLFIF